MASTFYLKQGDTDNPIRVILRDGSGPIDLTGRSIYFTMRLQGSSTLKVNRATASADDDDLTTGAARYDWAAGDIDTPGVYECEWELVRTSNGKKLTVPDTGYDLVQIADDLA